MKTAVWLYLFIFVAFFDLHAQYPILSPYAISLGAAPSFIGLILGIYSITHLPGNILAGYGVDRYGSKPFIIVSLILAGILLLFQSQVTNPWQLLVVRSFSGFVLAFLSPSCQALLAKLASDHIQRGKLMAGNGLVHTLASVVSPAAGAFLVAKLGFATSFLFLGWGLIATGLLAIVGIREHRYAASTSSGSGTSVSASATAVKSASNAQQQQQPADSTGQTAEGGIPWRFYAIPLAISCSQGILFFELPLMKEAKESILTSGILFSMVSLGALLTLSLLFLNRYSPLRRTVIGCLWLAIVFFGMAIHWSIPLLASLFLIGMAKGIIFPAMANLLASVTAATRYGRAFSFLSIAFSVGSFLGPVAAGQLHDNLSPYFLAFCFLMLGLISLPLNRMRILPIVTQ